MGVSSLGKVNQKKEFLQQSAPRAAFQRITSPSQLALEVVDFLHELCSLNLKHQDFPLLSSLPFSVNNLYHILLLMALFFNAARQNKVISDKTMLTHSKDVRPASFCNQPPKWLLSLSGSSRLSVAPSGSLYVIFMTFVI